MSRQLCTRCGKRKTTSKLCGDCRAYFRKLEAYKTPYGEAGRNIAGVTKV